MNKILLAGGAGYIGSHTYVALKSEGYSPIIVDNFFNSSMSVIDSLKKITGEEVPFFKLDITKDLSKIGEIEFDSIIHFAGYKSVPESIEKPLEYYKNNLLCTINLLEFAKNKSIKSFVFSSSAAVYGTADKVPVKESDDANRALKPYGETKVMSEKIIKDFVESNPDFNATILRYFNPVGAHESGLIGESPKDIPNNIMPYILGVASGEEEKLLIFGDDYPSKDGTGVRDYIHVMDLSRGHVAALKKQTKPFTVYNLGTSKGTSVLELVNAFQKNTGVKINYEITDRRDGDIPISYADASLANKKLGWKAELSIEDACRDGWNFKQKNLS